MSAAENEQRQRDTLNASEQRRAGRDTLKYDTRISYKAPTFGETKSEAIFVAVCTREREREREEEGREQQESEERMRSNEQEAD